MRSARRQALSETLLLLLPVLREKAGMRVF
jgi:hypothetical protein